MKAKQMKKILVLALAAGMLGAANATQKPVLQVSPVDSRYLADSDGQTFVPVGCNICFDRLNADGRDAAATRERFGRWMRAFAANGGNFMRVWLGHASTEIMPRRAGEFDPEGEKTLRFIVSLAEELGIKIKFTLESFRRTIPDANAEDPGRIDIFTRPLYAPYAKTMDDFFRREECARIFLQKVDRLKELGFGESPAVAAWELWNEIDAVWPVAGDYTHRTWKAAVDPWTRRMLRELKARFPRQLALQSLGSFSTPGAFKTYDWLAGLADNDILQVHRYYDPGASLDVCCAEMDVLAADSIREMRDRAPSKPVVLAETGAVKANHAGPSERYPADKRGTILHDELFAPFFAGSCASGQPWHWDHQYIDGNNLWGQFAQFKKAIAGVDPAAEHFQPIHFENHRLRFWCLRGATKTMIWIRTKNGDFKTVTREESEEWINDIPARFSVYDPWNDVTTNVTDGKMPEFQRDVVVTFATKDSAYSLLPLGAAKAADGVLDAAAPKSVSVETNQGWVELERRDGAWRAGDVCVALKEKGGATSVEIQSPQKLLRFVRVVWPFAVGKDARVYKDAWERLYGGLGGWFAADACGALPWFFLVTDGGRTDGVGVRVQPNAFAAWKLAKGTCEILIDVRAGSRPLRLGGRTLEAVEIVTRKGAAGETPFEAARAFARTMCPSPRLPSEPVYGFNDWYCNYGQGTAEAFLSNAKSIASLVEGEATRPFIVADDGWQLHEYKGDEVPAEGPWSRSTPRWGMPMPDWAARVRALGGKPGLWYRPFMPWTKMPEEWKIPGVMNPEWKRHARIDPTVPSFVAHVKADVARFRSWGMRIIKVDFLTYDWCGEYGLKMDDRVVTNEDSRWRDDTRTSAEVIGGLHRAIREAAGDDMLVIGCNALNHLVPGVFEIQRTGGDTSGKDWARTRRTGPAALGMRAFMDRVFYVVDADCAGLAEAGAIPWEKNSQWIDVLGRSGTAVFVSWPAKFLDAQTRPALEAALRRAARPRPTLEPLDWTTRFQPTRWSDGASTFSYDW